MLDTICFESKIYTVKEDVENVTMIANLSKPLNKDIVIRFRYFDLNGASSKLCMYKINMMVVSKKVNVL